MALNDALNIFYTSLRCRWQTRAWWTADRWWSPVYHTDRSPKLTAPETISRSRDMVGAHQNPPKFKRFTWPNNAPWGTVCHPWASTCYRQPTYQIWSLYLHSLWRYERRYKMSKRGSLG